jgi:hypothetical protein
VDFNFDDEIPIKLVECSDTDFIYMIYDVLI